MPRYAAFLRAVNVGGRTVKMAELKRTLESSGLTNVETFIASGNAVFDSPAKSAAGLQQRIETALERRFGFDVAVFLRTLPELRAAAGCAPFGANPLKPASRLYVGFMAKPPMASAARALESAGGRDDRFAVRGREVYWLSHVKFSESEFDGGRLEKMLDRALTLRNSTTVQKMAAKYAAQ